jgi:hypothetical protein
VDVLRLSLRWKVQLLGIRWKMKWDVFHLFP